MQTAQSGGISMPMVLTILFFILKLTGVITWAWVWVFSPLWIMALIIIAIVFFAFLFAFIGSKL